MTGRPIPILTGREIDFRKTYFGHDIAILEQDSEQGGQRVAGWCRPLPVVGDVLIARAVIHGAAEGEQRLAVLEVDYVDEIPPGFRALVANLPGRDPGPETRRPGRAPRPSPGVARLG